MLSPALIRSKILISPFLSVADLSGIYSGRFLMVQLATGINGIMIRVFLGLFLCIIVVVLIYFI